MVSLYYRPTNFALRCDSITSFQHHYQIDWKMRGCQTPRGHFYSKEKKVVSVDRGLYKGAYGYVLANRHIAYLGNAVCLDRISIGFVPSTKTKFTGPITITRPEVPSWRKTIDYSDFDGPIDYEWIRVFNLSVPKREISVNENFKGIALIEEEGMLKRIYYFSLLQHNDSFPFTQASYIHYSAELTHRGYVSIHTGGFITSYVRWFIRYIKLYFQDTGRKVEILSFFDMDKGGIKILHQMNQFANADTVTDFESKIKFPTKWVALRYSYLSHLITPTHYGGAGLQRNKLNLMTCDQTCVETLEAWLVNNDHLLMDAQDPVDAIAAANNAAWRRQEILFMISNQVILSLASVPVDQMIADMKYLIEEAI